MMYFTELKKRLFVCLLFFFDDRLLPLRSGIAITWLFKTPYSKWK